MRLTRVLFNKVVRAVNEADTLESKDWDKHELSVYDPTPRMVRQQLGIWTNPFNQVIQKMLKMADLKKNEVLYDL